MDTVNPYSSSGSVALHRSRRRQTREDEVTVEGWREVQDAFADYPNSVVYVVIVGDTVKIGCTVDPRRRLAQLSATPTDLLLVLPGSYAEERALHERFAAHLAHGREWFHHADEILAWVNSERDRMGVPAATWSTT